MNFGTIMIVALMIIAFEWEGNELVRGGAASKEWDGNCKVQGKSEKNSCKK